MTETKIAEQLKYVWDNFIEKYNLQMKVANFYEVCFLNDRVEIVFNFNKYFDEYTTIIVNRKDGSKHAVINILIKKNALGQKIMDENQIAESELFKDKMDRKFYSEKVLLSKFCDDILKGDFSVMN